MAKDKTTESKGNAARGKITVVMFQIDGSDDTLRDAIKVLGQGIEKLSPGGQIYRALPTVSAPTRVNGTIPQASESEPAEPEYVESGVPEDVAESAETSTGNSEKPKKKRIQKAIVAVKGIDWDSDQSFRDYAKQKNPSNAQEKYLVVAGWFKNHRDVSVIGPGHIVAAFDVMDWQKPENIPNVFAVIKNTKEWFDKGEKSNEWVLAQRGLNALDRLGKGESES